VALTRLLVVAGPWSLVYSADFLALIANTDWIEEQDQLEEPISVEESGARRFGRWIRKVLELPGGAQAERRWSDLCLVVVTRGSACRPAGHHGAPTSNDTSCPVDQES
jgi:hypothetical protein